MDCRNGWFTRVLPGNGLVPKWVIGPILTLYCNLNISIGLEQLDNNRIYIYYIFICVNFVSYILPLTNHTHTH